MKLTAYILLNNSCNKALRYWSWVQIEQMVNGVKSTIGSLLTHKNRQRKRKVLRMITVFALAILTSSNYLSKRKINTNLWNKIIISNHQRPKEVTGWKWVDTLKSKTRIQHPNEEGWNYKELDIRRTETKADRSWSR